MGWMALLLFVLTAQALSLFVTVILFRYLKSNAQITIPYKIGGASAGFLIVFVTISASLTAVVQSMHWTKKIDDYSPEIAVWDYHKNLNAGEWRDSYTAFGYRFRQDRRVYNLPSPVTYLGHKQSYASATFSGTSDLTTATISHNGENEAQIYARYTRNQAPAPLESERVYNMRKEEGKWRLHIAYASEENLNALLDQDRFGWIRNETTIVSNLVPLIVFVLSSLLISFVTFSFLKSSASLASDDELSNSIANPLQKWTTTGALAAFLITLALMQSSYSVLIAVRSSNIKVFSTAPLTNSTISNDVENTVDAATEAVEEFILAIINKEWLIAYDVLSEKMIVDENERSHAELLAALPYNEGEIVFSEFRKRLSSISISGWNIETQFEAPTFVDLLLTVECEGQHSTCFRPIVLRLERENDAWRISSAKNI